jgi:predicted TIM-barrel fold metal-dependent hydrolase
VDLVHEDLLPHRSVDLLPDPERRERKYLIVSADDHLVEPPHMFSGRLPAKYVHRAPTVVSRDGAQGWLVEDHFLGNVGFNAIAGRRLEVTGDPERDPITFADMRPGAWDIHSRIKDMDLDGVYASLCFPSFLGGFGGVRLQSLSADRDFSLALVRAWNDWHIEEWVGSYPNRIIGCQLAWLHDPVIAAAEIRRNAERGFRAVTLPEAPHLAGLPSLHCGYWDPIIAACAETGTVVCLHTGSSGRLPESSPDAPREVMSALFGAGYALTTTVDWFYSPYPRRHPDLKIVIAEGGIGWVPSLLDRFDHSDGRYTINDQMWAQHDISRADTLLRNFWFCLLDEPSAMVHVDRIGVRNILFETDYPHADTSWPNSQALLDRHVSQLNDDAIARISWQNAAELFRLEVPLDVRADHDAY